MRIPAVVWPGSPADVMPGSDPLADRWAEGLSTVAERAGTNSSMPEDPSRENQVFAARDGRLLRVVLDDDDGVIGFGDDPDVRTAPLGVVGGAVVGVLTGLSPR